MLYTNLDSLCLCNTDKMIEIYLEFEGLCFRIAAQIPVTFLEYHKAIEKCAVINVALGIVVFLSKELPPDCFVCKSKL